MLASGNLDFSFSGLKTAVLTLARKEAAGGAPESLPRARKADIALEIQSAIVDVLVAKALAALDATGRARLVVAGGVGANRALRARLTDAVAARGGEVYFPDLAFCTDNGAMIALVGALRLGAGGAGRPRVRGATALGPRVRHARNVRTPLRELLRRFDGKRMRGAFDGRERRMRDRLRERRRVGDRKQRGRAFPPSPACARESTRAAARVEARDGLHLVGERRRAFAGTDRSRRAARAHRRLRRSSKNFGDSTQ